MKCPACDTEIPASSTRCPSCHASLAGVVAAGGLMPPAPDAPTITVMPDAGDDTTVLPRSAPPDPLRDATTVPSSLHRPDLFGDDAPTMMPGERPTGTAAKRQPTSYGLRASGDIGPLTPGEPFGPRYHIIRLLGLGGMGAVYQAWDAELGVAVAIKVIRPEVMADPVAAKSIERRFKRELLLARQVTHKNVVRIHDLGEIDGVKYITMSYVDGEELASILKRDGKLPVAKALAFARPVISGLAAAHAAGVVHRDLKPANIMIGKDGEALIMDFGIARSSAAPDAKSDVEETLPAEFRRAAASDVEATKAGSVLGTVRYMAPEQAIGEKVDQRADVYAMGLILYDMLLGSRRADLSDSALAELKARIEKAPPTVNSVLPEIPAAVDALVSRCLEPDLTKRYQTTSDLEADLNRLDENGEPIPIRKVVGLPLMAAVVVLLLGLATGTWWYQRQFIPPPEHEPVSVVIADFQNDTGDAAFDGVLEPMLRRALEGASFISAFDRQGIRRTLGVQPPEQLDEVAAREIAVEQGLGVVLAGSLNPLGSGYRVSVRAIQPLTGEVITTAEETASGRDQVLEAATRLISRVRNALGDETSESAQILAMASLSATSLDVAGLYAAALEASSNNRFEEQRQSLLKAVSLDPAFGIGHQSLAVASRNLGRAEDAETHINEALRYLDGMTERERYNTRGMYFRLTGDYQQCVTQYGELIARYAADVVGRNQLALCLTKLRRLAEAVDEMRSIVQMLPNRALFRVNLSWYASYAGQFQDAEEQARAIEDLDVYATHALAFALLGQGQVDQAMAAYEELSTFGTLGASMAASGLAARGESRSITS